MNSRLYRMYGMEILAEDLDPLDAFPGTAPASLTLTRGAISFPDPQPWHTTSSMQCFRSPDGGSFLFRYADDCQFLIDREGAGIRMDWPAQYSFRYVAPYLVGPVMGFTLRFRGVTTLHASVIEIGGRAIVITAAAGMGKSTTAAAFAKFGVSVLSDDLAPIRTTASGFEVAPGYPRICLRPPSVQNLFGGDEALDLITPGWDKRYLSLRTGGFRFRVEPLPLGAIYWLSDREDSNAAPRIEPMTPQDALRILVAHTYANGFPDRGMQARDMRLFGSLISRGVPVKKLTAHASAARIGDLCEVVRKDAEDV